MRLRYQFEFIQAIRDFFTSSDFVDVITPPMVENPGMEVHIHPFQVFHTIKNESNGNYLHTSPEFMMKKLLSLKEEKLERIFQVSYCFRDEPVSPEHRPQFLMLEWYRKNERYEKIMSDFEELVEFVFQKTTHMPQKKKLPKPVAVTVQEIFHEFCQIDILQFLEKDELKNLIQKNFKDVPLPESSLEWEDYYFLLFLNKIEPKLKHYPFLFLYEYPSELAALSTIKKEDRRVCERFEAYINGVEIGNCFNEEPSFSVIEKRFQYQELMKKQLYSYQLNRPKDFLETMQRGYPISAGIAVGVERLFAALIKTENPFFS